MNPSEKKSPQATMFAKADELNHNCYIARWLESGKFAYESHKDIDAWLDKYKQVPNEKKMYGEIHREGKAVCEYYDIDEKQQGQDMEEWIDGFLKTRNEFCKTIDLPPIRKHHLLVLESCNDDKFSLHMLVRNKRHFDTIGSHKLFARQFQSWLEDNEGGFSIDTSVYNKNSVFRCVYSHKPNQTRIFKPTEADADKDIKLTFCSTIEEGSIPHNVAEPEKKVREVVPHTHTGDELVELFWKLDKRRWDERESWRNLIWLGTREGIGRDELCELSAQSDKHTDEAVDDIIDGFRYDECGITMGSLKFYLREDLGDDEYMKLFPKKQTEKLTSHTLKLGHRDVAEVCSKKMNRLKYCNDLWYLCREANNLWAVVKKPHSYIVKVIQDEINDLIAGVSEAIKNASDERRKALEEERKELFKCYSVVAGTGYAPCVMNYLTEYLFENKFNEKIDYNIGFLSFKNGILDLKTGVFRKGLLPEDYISFTLDFDYKKNNVDKNSFVWKQFKKVLNNNDEHLDYFMSLVGHSFTGESALVKAMYFMIDGSGDGKGDNGKTFLFNIIKSIMGDYVGKPTSSLLEKNNAKVHKQITGLKGKRFIYMEEFPQKAINCDLMKELGDGGEMNNEVMFGTMEKINIIGMFFALSNHTPKLDADESAGYNRYKEVSFKSHFDRTGDREEENEDELEYIADTDIGAKIVNDYRDEVVGLILQYAMRFYKSGIPPTPIEFLKAEQETKASNDDFLEWFEESCEKGEEGDNLAEKNIVEMSGIKADKVRNGMARLGYKYMKDLRVGLGRDMNGKPYKGGYEGVRLSSNDNMQSGESSGSMF